MKRLIWYCLALSTMLTVPSALKAQPNIWDPAGIQEFSLTDQDGKPVTKETLRGKEWVASFTFTRCPDFCPRIIGQVKKLQDETGVTLVNFSVQPEVDTPDVLRNYSHQYSESAKPDANGNKPKWYWLTGDRDKIYNLIIKSFKMPVGIDYTKPGSQLPYHTNNVVHVDETGRILGKYDALNPDELVLLRKILQGKEPRGKMASPALPKGTVVEVEGAKAAGLTFTRPSSEDEPNSSTVTESEARGDEPRSTLPDWVRALPAVNASLNGLATILLLTGYVLIKLKHAHSHKVCMLSSFATSIVFLGCYLVYHWFAGSKKFPGTGTIRTVYLLILVTHIVLAAAVPVLASMTMYRAFRGQWEKHKRIARITFPIWVYVSVTGVVIYVMLYHWPVSA